MRKMKLVPVKVPWMISPAYEIEEYQGGLEEVSVELSCIRSRSEKNKVISKLNKRYNNNIPDEIWNMSGCMKIKVKFSPINFFCICYPQKEIYGMDENLYDLSMLKSFYDGTIDFQKVWDEEKMCPNPKMYEVQNSKLKDKLYITDDTIKHWLIVGHEEEIHVLAKSFIWHEEKIV